MKRLLPLLALAGTLTPSLSMARIGETPEQCAVRYGVATEEERYGNRRLSTYISESVSTTCYYTDGRCTGIQFALWSASRIDPSRAEFSETQIASLLLANAGGSRWVKIKADKFETLFQTENSAIQARLWNGNLYIQTSADIEQRKALTSPSVVDKIIANF